MVYIHIKLFYPSRIFLNRFYILISDLITNCESELLKNENLFSDDTLLSQMEEPLAMDTEGLDFLNFSNSEEFKEFQDFKDPNIIKSLPNGNVMLTPTITENTQQISCVSQQQKQQQQQQPQLQDITSVQNRQQRISVTPAPTVFNSQYAIPQNVNFSVQSPVVTIAPVTPQTQLLLPAKFIKSESLVYSRGSQAVTSTSVPHQIHTLVNTANGPVLTTGEN